RPRKTNPNTTRDKPTMHNSIPAPAYQAPALDNEAQLLRTLERVCLQHGATDHTTRRLLRDVITSVRHATDHKRVTRALEDYGHSHAPDVDDLDIITGFAARVLAAHDPDQPEPDTRLATADDLAPEIRHAIAIVIELIWEREKD